MPEWMGDKQKRLDKIREAMKELEAEAQQKAEAAEAGPKNHKAKLTGKPEEKATRNFTDPECRLMKTSEGFIPGYNAQAAVDSESQVIVAQLITNNGSDVNQMIPLLKAIRKNVGRQAKEISADSGYCSAVNLKALRQRRIQGYVATDRIKHKNVSQWVQRMRERLRKAAHRSRYRLRKQTVEPVFGHIKFARGFRQFLLRGIRKVAGEWSLLCTAHNLLKLAAANR
jgi:hypothetical protein